MGTIFIIITGVISILLLFIIFARIYISFELIYEKKQKVAIIHMSLYRLHLYKKTIDFSERNDLDKWDVFLNKLLSSKSMTNVRKEINLIFNELIKTTVFLKRLLNKSKCNELSWHTYIGTGEASTSGILAGGIWILKGLFLGVLSKQCLLACQPQLTVSPTFQRQHIYTHFNCIVSLRAGQAIYIFLK